jgi:hypothetical protein
MTHDVFRQNIMLTKQYTDIQLFRSDNSISIKRLSKNKEKNREIFLCYRYEGEIYLFIIIITFDHAKMYNVTFTFFFHLSCIR